MKTATTMVNWCANVVQVGTVQRYHRKRDHVGSGSAFWFQGLKWCVLGIGQIDYTFFGTILNYTRPARLLWRNSVSCNIAIRTIADVGCRFAVRQITKRLLRLYKIVLYHLSPYLCFVGRLSGRLYWTSSLSQIIGRVLYFYCNRRSLCWRWW